MTTLSDKPSSGLEHSLGNPLDFASFGGARPTPDLDALSGLALAGDIAEPSLHEAPSFADMAEIDRFEDQIKAYLAGTLDPEEFRRDRLWMGCYGIRHQPDVHMIRTKQVGGVLTADMLDAAGDVAEFQSRGYGHITTRQNIQFHMVKVEDLPAALRRLAEAGLTTREACGDTVRNITACHLAGSCPLEVLDVNAAVEAVMRHFLRNPLTQNLPRKFKISASGCAVDCALTGIHDIGIMAVEVDGVKGFRLMVGGGLGTEPTEAKVLEQITAPHDLIVTSEAILRVWDREMPRGRRAKARMKFLITKMGIEEFREKVFAERELLKCSSAYRNQPPADFLPQRAVQAGPTEPEDPNYTSRYPIAFAKWRETNVIAQRQPDRFAAYVTLQLGDITADQFRALAAVSRKLGIHFRSTVRQNLVARDLREGDLGVLFDFLNDVKLGVTGAERAAGVVSCPGAETCNLALTASRGVGQATIDALIAAGLGDEPLNINVSGCPNSCGQQQMADIGLSGQVRRVGTDEAPGYRILLGGRVTEGGARFGQYVAKAPARRTPEAVVAIVSRWVAERTQGERFGEWVDRVGAKEIGLGVADFDAKRSREEAPEDFIDWGETTPFEVILGRGECAG